jgi:hypothetical protein
VTGDQEKAPCPAEEKAVEVSFYVICVLCWVKFAFHVNRDVAIVAWISYNAIPHCSIEGPAPYVSPGYEWSCCAGSSL